jgi:hypothetical protein
MDVAVDSSGFSLKTSSKWYDLSRSILNFGMKRKIRKVYIFPFPFLKIGKGAKMRRGENAN